MKSEVPYTKSNSLDATSEAIPICFIVNPYAGTNIQKRIREAVEENLDHNRFKYAIWFTEHAGHGATLAQKAQKEGYKIVVAVGGDGSINEIGTALLHSDTIMGIVPAGSGNGLAMHLGYGRSLDAAVRKINTAQEHIIDCGTLNKRPFFNVAGIGFDGKVSNMMRNSKMRGFIPYFYNSLLAGLREMCIPFDIKIGGDSMQKPCFAISIANGPMYGYNMRIAPDAKLDDGLLSVVLVKKALKIQYAQAVLASLISSIYKLNFIEHYEAANFSIDFKGVQNVHLDGEGFEMEGPIHFSVLPKSLRILIPK